MPIHDWTRVRPGTFHDFHTAWITHLKEALNAGILPSGYHAMAEQPAGDVGPDVLTLQAGGASGRPWTNGTPQGAIAVAERPPQVDLIATAEAAACAAELE